MLCSSSNFTVKSFIKFAVGRAYQNGPCMRVCIFIVGVFLLDNKAYSSYSLQFPRCIVYVPIYIDKVHLKQFLAILTSWRRWRDLEFQAMCCGRKRWRLVNRVRSCYVYTLECWTLGLGNHLVLRMSVDRTRYVYCILGTWQIWIQSSQWIWGNRSIIKSLPIFLLKVQHVCTTSKVLKALSNILKLFEILWWRHAGSICSFLRAS